MANSGNIEEALAVAEASLQLEPDSIPALENASQVLFKANRLEDVLKCLERLCALNPDEKRYQADFARLCQKTQQFEKAFAAYLKLWEDDKATPSDYAMMGQLAFLSQRSDEALPAWADNPMTRKPPSCNRYPVSDFQRLCHNRRCRDTSGSMRTPGLLCSQP